ADGQDLDLEPAPGRLVDHLLAGGVAEECLAERRTGGDDVVAAALLLDRTDEVGRRLVVALHPNLDDRPGHHGRGVGRLDHHRRLQDRLQLADPGLVVALLGLGRVVVGVLPDVAVLPGALDPLRDLTPAGTAALVELLEQPLVGLRGKMCLFHRPGGYRSPGAPRDLRLLQRAGVVGHPDGGHAAVGLRLPLDHEPVTGLDVALRARLRPNVAGRLRVHDALRRAVGLAHVDVVAVDVLHRSRRRRLGRIGPRRLPGAGLAAPGPGSRSRPPAGRTRPGRAAGAGGRAGRGR